MTTLERVQKIIAESTGFENAPANSKLMDLCDDSLEAASVIVELEVEFTVDIEGFHERATVGDLVQFIDKQKAA